MERMTVSAACLVLLILAVGLTSPLLYYAAAALFVIGLFIPRSKRGRQGLR